MAHAAHDADLASVLERIVLPAVRAVLRPDEPRRLDVRRTGSGDVELELAVGDEVFRYPVVQADVRMSEAEWRDHLASLLVDWVAESRFGWGQDRSSGPG